MYVARSQGSRSRSRRDSSRATCTRYIQQQIYTHAYFDYRLLQAAGHPASRPFTCTTPASQPAEPLAAHSSQAAEQNQFSMGGGWWMHPWLVVLDTCSCCTYSWLRYGPEEYSHDTRHTSDTGLHAGLHPLIAPQR